MIALAALLAQPAAPPPVPEGIHSISDNDRATLCGEDAPTVDALRARLEHQLTLLPGTPRFTALEDRDHLRVWTFTTAAHPAHPAVACRTVQSVPAGGTSVNLEIACFSTRAKCDALYREFEAINAQMTASLRGETPRHP